MFTPLFFILTMSLSLHNVHLLKRSNNNKHANVEYIFYYQGERIKNIFTLEVEESEETIYT